MVIMIDGLQNVISSIRGTLGTISVTDIIDIICVAVMLYYIYKFIRDRRAGKLAVGVFFFIVFMFLAELLEMQAMQFIFTNVFQVGMITIVILFQPELRSALEKMGAQPLKGFKSFGDQKNLTHISDCIATVSETAAELSATKTGALIVFERSTKLGDLILTGTVINSDVSKYLIKNIFYNKAPLHDGALIIRDGRLYSAGCLLPLSSNADIIKDLGTRHRAAIGMSENSDAVVVVVSEETGTISVAVDGYLHRPFTEETLREKLTSLLVPADESANGKGVSRIRKIFRHSSDKAEGGGSIEQK